MNFLHQEPRKVVSFAVFKSRLLRRISHGVCGLLDFIPGLFRLSVTFYNFIHFFEEANSLYICRGYSVLRPFTMFLRRHFFLLVWPHIRCIAKSLSVKTGTKSTLKGQMHNP